MAFKTVCVHGFGAVKTEIERMIYIAEQLTLSDQQEEDWWHTASRESRRHQ